MDVTVKVLEPADSYALISLADAKIMLGISAGDVSGDVQLQMIIDQNSAVIANLCDRIFGKETVTETWQCIAPMACPDGSCRIYLTHAPVLSADITSVETPLGTFIDPDDYQLEERTGKLFLPNGCSGDIVINYTGGYLLPDEAPLDLQQVTGLMARQQRTEATTAGTVGSGVRMIAHKGSRIMFHNPKDLAGGTTTSGGVSMSATDRAVKDLLLRYKRLWI